MSMWYQERQTSNEKFHCSEQKLSPRLSTQIQFWTECTGFNEFVHGICDTFNFNIKIDIEYFRWWLINDTKGFVVQCPESKGTYVSQKDLDE